MTLSSRFLRHDVSRFLQSPVSVFLARHFPRSLLRAYIILMGSVYYLIRFDQLLQIGNNLRLIGQVQSGGHRRLGLILRVLGGILDHYREKTINAYRPLEETIQFLKAHVRIKNKTVLDQAFKNCRSCLLVTGHFGGVEYLPLTLAAAGYPVAMVLRFKTQRLRDELRMKSRNVDLLLIDADDSRVIFKALKTLRSGRLLITVCDEFKHWVPDSDQQVHVFGNRVPLDRTLNILCRRSNASACLGLMLRGKKGYDLQIEHLSDRDSHLGLSAVAWQAMERYVFRYPHQWYQWKDIQKGLSQYINRYEGTANSYHPPLRVKDSLLPRGIT